MLVFQAFKFPDSMNVHFQCVVQVCRGQCPEPGCGGALPLPSPANNVDSYGAPAAAPLSVDSYGSPLAPPNGAINPRIPSQSQYSSGSQRRVSVVRPDTPAVQSNPIPLKPGYNNFNKRLGESAIDGTNGRPRSLEFGEGIEAQPLKAVEEPERSSEELVKNDLEEEKSRDRRSLKDAAGNRVLNLRVRREAEQEVEEADIQTERIIQVEQTRTRTTTFYHSLSLRLCLPLMFSSSWLRMTRMKSSSISTRFLRVSASTPAPSLVSPSPS